MAKPTFGAQLKTLRLRGRNPHTNKQLSQAWLAEKMGDCLGTLSYTGASVSNWENSKSRLPDSPRRPLLCLLQVLKQYSQLTLAEAQALLAAGDYRALEAEEQQQLFGAPPRPPATAPGVTPPPTSPAPLPAGWQPGKAPPVPQVLIGRETDVQHLRARLQTEPAPSGELQRLIIVRGWPGLGKTSLAATLAHDAALMSAFPDGVLWVSLGPNPNVLTELATWGRALGTEALLRAQTIEEASTRLSALLRDKRLLLIVDDVWEAEHALPFLVGGHHCATLLTTRENQAAQALAPSGQAIYHLAVLSEAAALEVLTCLAPTVIEPHRPAALELARELEGLPLALQVAGRLLNTESQYGFSVMELLQELRDGVKILRTQAPAGRIGLVNETSLTVAALLQKSTDRLTAPMRDCYAFLGVFAPKPATFDAQAMRAVWEVDDPQPMIRELVNRGLLEYVPAYQRYQMHALLVAHAKSLVS